MFDLFISMWQFFYSMTQLNFPHSLEFSLIFWIKPYNCNAGWLCFYVIIYKMYCKGIYKFINYCVIMKSDTGLSKRWLQFYIQLNEFKWKIIMKIPASSSFWVSFKYQSVKICDMVIIRIQTVMSTFQVT